MTSSGAATTLVRGGVLGFGGSVCYHELVANKAQAKLQGCHGQAELHLTDDVARLDGKAIPLSEPAVAVLHHLLRDVGRLVAHADLLRTGWPNTRVSDASLRQVITELRRAFAHLPVQPIETVRNAGYRLRPAISDEAGESAASGVHLAPVLPNERLRIVLGAAALLGDSFELGVLQVALAMPLAELRNALLEACAARIVRALPEQQGYAFMYGAQRSAFAEALSTAEREDCHLALARALAGRVGDVEPRARDIAHHAGRALNAGGAELCAQFAPLAGQQARDEGLHAEAVRHYERALEASAWMLGADLRRVERLRLELAEALSRAGGQRARAVRIMLDVARLAARRHDVNLLIEAVAACVGPRGRQVDMASSLPSTDAPEIGWLEEALHAQDATVPRVRSLLLGALSFLLILSPDRARRLECSAESVALARDTGDVALLERALELRVYACCAPADLPAAVEAASELVEVAHLHGHLQVEREARNLHAVRLFRMGRGEAALAEDAQISLLDTLVDPKGKARAQRWKLLRELANASASEGTRLTQQAFDPNALRYDEHASLLIRLALFEYAKNGTNQLLYTMTSQLVRTYPRSLTMLSALASLAVEQGDPDAARSAFDRAIVPALSAAPNTATWLMDMFQLANAATHLDDPERAARVYERLEPFADQFLVFAEALVAGPLSGTLGMLAITMRRFDEAARWLASARAACEHPFLMSFPLLMVRLEAVRLAALRAAPGDHATVAVESERLEREFNALGMHYLAGRAVGLRQGLSLGRHASGDVVRVVAVTAARSR